MAHTMLGAISAETAMNTAVQEEAERLEVRSENIVTMPLGLLGFEDHKRYVLLSKRDEAPFLWFQMLEAPHQSFLVVAPALVVADYHPELSGEDVEFLGLRGPEEALVFNIVTLGARGSATVNLKGPLVINQRTLVGKQVIPLNASQYALQYPLHAAEPHSSPC